MSLYTDCGDIYISCECCNEIYLYYGNPHDLLLIEVPCHLVGYEVCIPTKWE